MAELIFHDVEWFAERGHPLLVLGVVDRPGEFLTVALTTSDAQALAVTPTADGIERMRLVSLVETILAQLDAHLQAIEFSVGTHRHLQATLEIGTTTGTISVTANFADAVALATRAGLPMLMADAELALAMPPRATATLPRDGPVQSPLNNGAIRAFVETLDLSWIDAHHDSSPNER